MNTTKHVILGLIASCLVASAANAQGLLGERYIGISGEYSRLSGFGGSVDGWGAGAEFNVPLTGPFARVGLDADLFAGYSRMREGEVKFDGYGVGGILRAFVGTDLPGLKPYIGTGAGFNYSRVRVFGESETDSTIAIPAEAGVEYAIGSFSIRPFYRYVWAVESGYEDFWTAGATAALWFSDAFGTALTLTHSDLDDGVRDRAAEVALLISF